MLAFDLWPRAFGGDRDNRSAVRDLFWPSAATRRVYPTISVSPSSTGIWC
jgi:hypothetical protein